MQQHTLDPWCLPDMPYQLRARSRSVNVIGKSKFLSDDDFFVRMLYKYSY